MTPRLKPGVRIEEYLPITDPDDEGTYNSSWGKAWIHAKMDDPAKPYMLANEFIGMRLAASFGLPTLPGEIAIGPEMRSWVTPRISATGGVSPPPATAQTIADANPTVVAGMVVFDAWIHNMDRTADNVLFEAALGLWLIDHENSLALPDGQCFTQKAADVAKTPLSWHEFAQLDIDQEALQFWLGRLLVMHEATVRNHLDEANRRGLIKVTERDWLLKYLLARRDNIASLVPTTGVPQPKEPRVGSVTDSGQYDLFSTGEE